MKRYSLLLSMFLVAIWGGRDATAYSWTQSDRLNAYDEDEEDAFGRSVSMGYQGELLIVGSPWDDLVAGEGEIGGSAFVFRRDGQNWAFEEKLYATLEVVGSGSAGFVIRDQEELR